MFKRKRFTEEEILDILKSGDSRENDVLDFLYEREFGKIEKFLIQRGANHHDAKDVFQDGILVFYEKVKRGGFRQGIAISTFLHTVTRNIWINRSKRQQKMVMEDSLEKLNVADLNLIQDILESKELESEVTRLMATLKKDCQQVLIMSIYQGLPMEEIARKVGLQDAQNARNKKYRCLKTLQSTISNSAYWQNLINELWP